MIFYRPLAVSCLLADALDILIVLRRQNLPESISALQAHGVERVGQSDLVQNLDGDAG